MKTSRQASHRAQWTISRTYGNALKPLALTNPHYVARYNTLCSMLIVITKYFDEDLLTDLGLMDGIH